MITLHFQIIPVPKGRPRFSSRGGIVRTHTPAETRAFESAIRIMAKQQFKAGPLLGPLHIFCKIVIPRPKSVKRTYPCVRPDLDNLMKGVMDALNGLLWHDDGQIIDLDVSKRYSTPQSPSGITVTVLQLQDTLISA